MSLRWENDEKKTLMLIYLESEKTNWLNFANKVNFAETKSTKRTSLAITTLDRPGLLASIAQVFSDCDINLHSAKITTFGEKAEDVFTVSNKDNLVLTQQEQTELADRLLEEINFE